MNQTALNFRHCYKQVDGAMTVDFLFAHRDELALPDKTAVSHIINLLFDKGGILGAFDRQRRMQGMLGFFFGEPGQDYRNKETLFIYVTAIARPYRLTRLFRDGLTYALRQFQQMGMGEIRMQAQTANRYTNKLYGRFAHPLSEDTTLRGYPVITYGNTIEDALVALEQRHPTTTFTKVIYKEVIQ